MRTRAAMAVCLLAAATAHAAELTPGRWQGQAEIPGYALHLTVDLDRNDAGAWIGSIVIPELAIKGATLVDIVQHDAALSFAIKGVLAAAPDQPARFEGKLADDASIAGTFTQAGNHASFTLRRVGAAQVDLPALSTPVAAAFEGTWTGDYELMGYPRHVTLTFANHAGGPPSADFTIVGKKNNKLPVDLITQSADFVRIESHEIGINFEGRLQPDRQQIRGTYEQGPIELPLVLHRRQGE